jgi:hypothetical protein
MSSSNVIVPSDFSKLIIEREKVWVDFDRSRRLAGDLAQLSNQIPDCVPAEPQIQFGTDSIPPTELETLFPMVNERIATANRLKAESMRCYEEIQAIKGKEKTVIIAMVIGGSIVLLILLILIISLVSGSSS